jgi:putative transposase
VHTHRHKVTTDSNHKLGYAKNLPDRKFHAEAPDQKWAGDISHIWTATGWLHLAVVVDLHSRRVIGWAVNDRMKRDLAISAFDMAASLRDP